MAMTAASGRMQSLRYDAPPESRIASKALHSRMYEAALSRIQLHPRSTSRSKQPSSVNSAAAETVAASASEPQPRPPPPDPEPHPMQERGDVEQSVQLPPARRFSLLTGKLEPVHAPPVSAVVVQPASAAPRPQQEPVATPRPRSPAAAATAATPQQEGLPLPSPRQSLSPEPHPAAAPLGPATVMGPKGNGPIASAAWLDSFKTPSQHFGAAVVKHYQNSSSLVLSSSASTAPLPSSWTSEEVVRNRQKQQLFEEQQRRAAAAAATRGLGHGVSRRTAGGDACSSHPPAAGAAGGAGAAGTIQSSITAASPPVFATVDSPFYQPHLAAKRAWRAAKQQRREERQRKRQEAAVAAAVARGEADDAAVGAGGNSRALEHQGTESRAPVTSTKGDPPAGPLSPPSVTFRCGLRGAPGVISRQQVAVAASSVAPATRGETKALPLQSPGGGGHHGGISGDPRIMRFLLPTSGAPLAGAYLFSAAQKSPLAPRATTRATAQCQTLVGSHYVRLTAKLVEEEQVPRAELLAAEAAVRRAMRRSLCSELERLVVEAAEHEDSLPSDEHGSSLSASVQEEEAEDDGELVADDTIGDDHVESSSKKIHSAPSARADAVVSSAPGDSSAAAAAAASASWSPGKTQREALAIKHQLALELDQFAERWPVSPKPVSVVMSNGFVMKQVLFEFGSLFSSEVFPGGFPVHRGPSDVSESEGRSVGDAIAYMTELHRFSGRAAALTGGYSTGSDVILPLITVDLMESDILNGAIDWMVEDVVSSVVTHTLETRGQ